MGVAEQFDAAAGRPRTLEPSGDATHDALTDQALGLDALHPLRDSEKRAAYDETVADAADDHSD